MAEGAAARASSAEEAVGRVRHHRVETIIRHDVLDIVGQAAAEARALSPYLTSIDELDIIAAATTSHLIGVDDHAAFRCSAEHLRDVHAVVMPEPVVPLHLVALLLVPGAELHQGEIGKDVGLLLAISSPVGVFLPH
jgi:hypothetical protein